MDVVSYILAKKNGGSGGAGVKSLKDLLTERTTLYKNIVACDQTNVYMGDKYFAELYDNVPTLVSGVVYTVRCNGIEYTCESYLDVWNNTIIGNGNLLSPNNFSVEISDTGEPFCIQAYESGMTVFSNSTSEPVTFDLEIVGDIINPIPNEYLREDVVHLSNKYLYNDVVYSETVNVDTKAEYGNGYVVPDIYCSDRSIYDNGDQLIIIIDSVERRLDVGTYGVLGNGTKVFGNGALFDSEYLEDTGEDYYISWYGTSTMFKVTICLKDPGQHDVSVYVETKKTIATQDYVTEQLNKLINGNEVEY